MHYIDNSNFKLNNTVVSIGNFDGLHLGHQKLINTTTHYSKQLNLKSVVFSFYPHPRAVLRDEIIPTIFSPDEKKLILSSFKVDYFIEYPFEKSFSDMTPKEFFEEIIIDKLGCKVLVVGEDYHFGAKKSGDISTLQHMCKDYKVILLVIPKLLYSDEKIGSTDIRKFILEDKFEMAEKYLGRPYFIRGRVVEGRKIGRTMGFPTVNLIVPEGKLIPRGGVYATKTLYNGTLYNSVTNVGRNPTVGGKKTTIETSIFEFEKTVYGEIITVYFYKKLRDEKKFNNIDELRNQIWIDSVNAKKYFGIK